MLFRSATGGKECAITKFNTGWRYRRVGSTPPPLPPSILLHPPGGLPELTRRGVEGHWLVAHFRGRRFGSSRPPQRPSCTQFRPCFVYKFCLSRFRIGMKRLCLSDLWRRRCPRDTVLVHTNFIFYAEFKGCFLTGFAHTTLRHGCRLLFDITTLRCQVEGVCENGCRGHQESPSINLDQSAHPHAWSACDVAAASRGRSL